MDDRDNYLRNAELYLEQGGSHIDGILNNLPAPPTEPEEKERIPPPPGKRRNRDREDR